MALRVFAAGKDWLVRSIQTIFVRHESAPVESPNYQINDDAGVIRIDETIDRDSFVAGMQACDALHRISAAEAGKSAMLPLHNNAITMDGELKEPS